MTATTTIRIDDELKARVAEAASRAGQTAHAFMLDAIAQTVVQAEGKLGGDVPSPPNPPAFIKTSSQSRPRLHHAGGFGGTGTVHPTLSWPDESNSRPPGIGPR
jgi:hypothetical protein